MFEKLTNNSAHWSGLGLVSSILILGHSFIVYSSSPSLSSKVMVRELRTISAPPPPPPPPHRIEEVYTIDRGWWMPSISIPSILSMFGKLAECSGLVAKLSIMYTSHSSSSSAGTGEKRVIIMRARRRVLTRLMRTSRRQICRWI